MTKQRSLHLFKFGFFIAMTLYGGEASSMDDDLVGPSRPATERRGVVSALDIPETKTLDEKLFGTKAQNFKDGRLFTAIMMIVNAHSGTSSNTEYTVKKRRLTEKGKYLFFVPGTKYKKASFYPDRSFDSSLRLDIEGDAGEGEYVNIQYQQGSGLSATSASIDVKKGDFISPNHLLFCLLKSTLKRNGIKVPPTIRTDNPDFVSNKKSAQVKRKKLNK